MGARCSGLCFGGPTSTIAELKRSTYTLQTSHTAIQGRVISRVYKTPRCSEYFFLTRDRRIMPPHHARSLPTRDEAPGWSLTSREAKLKQTRHMEKIMDIRTDSWVPSDASRGRP